MAFGLLIPLCYLTGAVPFGLLVARLTHGVDVREHGSGNTGMTNVLRTAGYGPAAAVLVLDAGKGVLAVLLARLIWDSPYLEVAAGLSVLVGHIWSVFLRFHGGKGIATGVGALCALSPLAGMIALGVSLPIMLVSKYVSLGSIVGTVTAVPAMVALATLAPSLPLGVPSPVLLLYPSIGAPLVVFKHRENISRLLKGQEHKLGRPVMAGKSSSESSNG